MQINFGTSDETGQPVGNFVLLTVHHCIISQIKRTMCTNLFNTSIYFSSLHVSDIHVPLITIKLPKLCVASTCHTVWMASGLLVGVNKKQFFNMIQSI
jgi:hypothetical protein